ncbi:MAG TPA: sigma-70 family RNA polymerase sigma factor [Solirubrobacterales bacterium]|nr:sigma-70 family RNA polymerase sigma factor [Solirubrobacterales bacterium]
METVNAKGPSPSPGTADDALRKRVAAELYDRNEAALRRVARRFSICEDDAEDALQRALEILLRKAPTHDPRELIKWTQTVVRHEALAIRRERERTLAGPAAEASKHEAEDWVALLPTPADGPPERAERREAVARSREALQALKPQELRALTLLAEGYSYAEIGTITGFSQTKVNRCLAEGRERFRRLVVRGEEGDRCTELQPLLSAFCDGEAKPEEVAELREHLRACSRCRATLRAYRAAPAAASALAPALPLPGSLWERARDALADLLGRFGGSAGGTAPQAAAGGGAGGLVAIAKVAIVCAGAAGGAAACVAGGFVPNPLEDGNRPDQPRVERQLSEVAGPTTPQPRSERAPEPEEEPRSAPKPTHTTEPEPEAESEPVVAEPAPVESAPEGTEYVPPAPEPVAEPAPVASSGGGSPAGEFGP